MICGTIVVTAAISLAASLFLQKLARDDLFEIAAELEIPYAAVALISRRRPDQD